MLNSDVLPYVLAFLLQRDIGALRVTCNQLRDAKASPVVWHVRSPGDFHRFHHDCCHTLTVRDMVFQRLDGFPALKRVCFENTTFEDAVLPHVECVTFIACSVPCVSSAYIRNLIMSRCDFFSPALVLGFPNIKRCIANA